jgi:hypothetical protein
MKYSNIIGALLGAILIWACTQKWVYIDSPEKYISGFKSTVDNNLFGRPGMLHVYLTGIAIVLFLIPKLWAKRLNFLFTALNFAWALRNFYAIGVLCRMGTCPEKQLGLYLIIICSLGIFIMSLLPKLEIKKS